MREDRKCRIILNDKSSIVFECNSIQILVCNGLKWLRLRRKHKNCTFSINSSILKCVTTKSLNPWKSSLQQSQRPRRDLGGEPHGVAAIVTPVTGRANDPPHHTLTPPHVFRAAEAGFRPHEASRGKGETHCLGQGTPSGSVLCLPLRLLLFL